MPKFKRSLVRRGPKLPERHSVGDDDCWLSQDNSDVQLMDTDGISTSESGNNVEYADVLQHMNGVQSNLSFDNGNASISSSIIDEETTNNPPDDLPKELPVDGCWNGDGVRSRASKVNWNPNISLLELACKLKCAEQNVFGQYRRSDKNIGKDLSNRESGVGQTSNASSRPTAAAAHVNEIKQEPFDLSVGPRADTCRLSDGSSVQGSVQSSRTTIQQPTVPVATRVRFDPESTRQHHGSSSIPLPALFLGAQYPRFSPLIPAPVSMLFGPSEFSQVIPQPVSALTNADKFSQSIPLPVSVKSAPETDEAAQPLYLHRNADGSHRVNGNDQELLGLGSSSAAKEYVQLNRVEQRYRCDECSYSTKSISHMQRHRANIHAKAKPFRCYICELEFSRSEKVRDHFVSFHPDVAYEAHRTRQFVHVAPAPVRDTSQQAKTRMQQRIRELFAGIEGNDVEMPLDPDRPFGCLRCSYATRDLWHLRRHVLDIHAVRKQFNCRVCRYATNRPTRLHAHMRGHGELFCERCDYSTTRLDQFTLHEKLCLPNAEGFRCRTCLAEFADREQLAGHVSSDHGSVLHMCVMCPYFAFTDEDLAGHDRAHTQDSRTCHLCGITFETFAEHDNHIYELHLHTDDGNLVCNICSDFSVPSDELNAAQEHIRSHLPVKVACTASGCNFQALLELTVDTHMENYHTNNASADGAVQRRPLVKPEPIALPQSPAVRVKGVMASPMTGTFACTICNRTPFKYYRSYEKHMAQHNRESHR